jgi:Flp pilus assembly pilin Flp
VTNFIRSFLCDEDGAVTVDWVVLTAGILAFGVVVAVSITNGATETSGSLGNRMSEAQVPEVRWQ